MNSSGVIDATERLRARGRQWSPGVDVWLLYSFPERTFYVVPTSEVSGRVYFETSPKYRVWSERWDLFSDPSLERAA
jgi:hypothetical protein